MFTCVQSFVTSFRNRENENISGNIRQLDHVESVISVKRKTHSLILLKYVDIRPYLHKLPLR